MPYNYTRNNNNNLCICRATYLKPPHVPGIAGVFQTVLIAFQKKFEEKSVNRKNMKQWLLKHRHDAVYLDYFSN